jgi:hypothetical protein
VTTQNAYCGNNSIEEQSKYKPCHKHHAEIPPKESDGFDEVVAAQTGSDYDSAEYDRHR